MGRFASLGGMLSIPTFFLLITIAALLPPSIFLTMTLGVGAGQMSRIDSARIASIKAQNAGLSLAGSVVASDAFFPFRDGLDVVVDAGATCVIQPGGSMRTYWACGLVLAGAGYLLGRSAAYPANSALAGFLIEVLFAAVLFAFHYREART